MENVENDDPTENILAEDDMDLEDGVPNLVYDDGSDDEDEGIIDFLPRVSVRILVTWCMIDTLFTSFNTAFFWAVVKYFTLTYMDLLSDRQT